MSETELRNRRTTPVLGRLQQSRLARAAIALTTAGVVASCTSVTDGTGVSTTTNIIPDERPEFAAGESYELTFAYEQTDPEINENTTFGDDVIIAGVWGWAEQSDWALQGPLWSASAVMSTRSENGRWIARALLMYRNLDDPIVGGVSGNLNGTPVVFEDQSQSFEGFQTFVWEADCANLTPMPRLPFALEASSSQEVHLSLNMSFDTSSSRPGGIPCYYNTGVGVEEPEPPPIDDLVGSVPRGITNSGVDFF